MTNNHVVVMPHNPNWLAVFKLEAEILRNVFKTNIVTINHIGSTAIPSIYAKPIIDIAIEVISIDVVDNKIVDVTTQA